MAPTATVEKRPEQLKAARQEEEWVSELMAPANKDGKTTNARDEDKILSLRTFVMPNEVKGSEADVKMGRALVAAWQNDGILQIAMDAIQRRISAAAMEADRAFVQLPLEQKKQFVSELSYAGYIGSKEEETAGKKDAAEIFTITKDVADEDERVRGRWPCHGPVCWPNEQYKQSIGAFMAMLGQIGEKVLALVALGLGLPMDTFTRITRDGWHHMRVLHFPDRQQSRTDRGIGSHTDYGMLVLASQDHVGGLFVRPPIHGEWRPRNWLPHETAAGLYEQDDEWYFVPPCAGTLTCFPGDMMQYLTNGLLLSTPHKVRLNTRERFALAYFHEPNFNAVCRPLTQLKGGDARRPEPAAIHYGTHFTNMFVRSYPDRVTTQRIMKEGKLAILDQLRNQAMAEAGHQNGCNCAECSSKKN